MVTWLTWCRSSAPTRPCKSGFSWTIRIGCTNLAPDSARKDPSSMSDETTRRQPIEGFDDIPGTTLFDAQRARQGYHVNMFCMSLMKAENRAAFKADEDQYLRQWPMTDEQHQAILERNWSRMIELGGNIYYLSKLF